MRISDWSSDVCSSDLVGDLVADLREYGFRRFPVPIGVGDIGNRGGETEVRADIDRDDFKPALPRVEAAGCIIEPVLQCCALNLPVVGADVRPEGLAAGSAGRSAARRVGEEGGSTGGAQWAEH